MQALPALLAGGGAAAAGGAAATTAGAIGLTQAGTALGALGGVVSTIGAVQQQRFQQQVALNNAQIAEQNAAREVQRASMEAQEADVRARGELGQLIADAGASGLNLNSGSSFLRRRSLEQLAAKDRGFIVAEGEARAQAQKQIAQDERAGAAQSGRAAILEGIGGGLDIGTTLISGASKVNRIRARAIRGAA